MPHLTIVVTGRNDNYDGNFDERLAFAMNRNMKSLPGNEFIFVEWNPYLDRPLTSQKLLGIFRNRLRCYVVHPKFHRTYCTIDEFLEYPAKNVGIRRSSGDFVACVNSDIIFAPDLVGVLKQPLEPKVVYRAARLDIEFTDLNVKFPMHYKKVLAENYGPTNAAGDFTLIDRASWFEYTGYCEEFPEQRLHKDAQMIWLFSDVGKMPIRNIGRMTHWRHPSSWSNGFCRSKVGDTNWLYQNCGYRRNKDTWGLAEAKEIERDGIIWLE